MRLVCTARILVRSHRASLPAGGIGTRCLHAGPTIFAKARKGSKVSAPTRSRKVEESVREPNVEGPNARPTLEATASKIQVLPFQFPPSHAIENIRFRTTVWETSTRSGFGWGAGLLTVVSAFLSRLGLPTNCMQPRLVSWKAVYLPFWNVDDVFSFGATVRASAYDVHVAIRGASIPATNVEPFSSLHCPYHALVENSKFEDFQPELHLKAFKEEDLLPEHRDHSAPPQPVALPFSDFLPSKFSDLHRTVASGYSDDTGIRLSPPSASLYEAIYPVLLPFYLVELEDCNPRYKGERMTALLLGSRLSQPGKQGLSNPLLDDKNDLDECHLALFKDGKWVQHDDEYYTALVLVLPKTHGRNAQMARSFTEMLFPHRDPKHIVDEEDFTDAIETSARGLLRQYFKRLKQTCSSLGANVSFPRCAAKIDEDPRSMKYGDRAKANRGFAEAFLRCRMAENLLKAIESVPQNGLDKDGQPLRFLKEWKMGRVSIWRQFKMSSTKVASLRAYMLGFRHGEVNRSNRELEERKPPWFRA